MNTLPILALLAAVLLIALGLVWLRGRGERSARPSHALARAALPLAANVSVAAPVIAPDVPPAADTTRRAPAPPGPQQILRELYAIAFDTATLDAATHAPRAQHAAVVAATVATLQTLEAQPRYAPRRPSLLPQLLQAINDGDASLRGMARIIAQDPALTGSLLRIANSPLYRVTSKPVESIERATALIGTEGIRSIIAAALMQPVLPPGGHFGTFPQIIWEHTLYSASAGETHAALVEGTDPFAAQMLGLLQGLGSIIVFRVARDQYEARPEVAPDANVIAALLETWSGSTARRIAESWGLSARITDALHDQLLEAPLEQLTPLGRSLRFGRLAGALLMLQSAGKITEEDALAALSAGESKGPQVARIWERLRKAVDPR